MKNIKNFDNFINEELNTETYLSAANKLDKLGHTNRSNKIKKYAYEIDKSDDLILPIDYDNYEYLISLNDIDLSTSDGTDEEDIRTIHIRLNYLNTGIDYYVDDNEVKFINDLRYHTKIDNRKSANNLVKLLKMKIIEEIKQVRGKEKRIYELALKNIHPNLFYED